MRKGAKVLERRRAIVRINQRALSLSESQHRKGPHCARLDLSSSAKAISLLVTKLFEQPAHEVDEGHVTKRRRVLWIHFRKKEGRPDAVKHHIHEEGKGDAVLT